MGRTTGTPALGALMASSILSRAKCALNTAAAKAEKLITEIKEDIKLEFGRSSSASADELKNNTEWNVQPVLDQSFEDRLCACVLNISKDLDKYILLSCKEEDDGNKVPIKLRVSADLLELLQDNKELQNLRFEFVPTKMQEDEFWKCFFMTFDKVKQEVHCLDSWERLQDQVKQEVQIESGSPRADPADEDAEEKATPVVLVPSSRLLRKLFSVIEEVRSVDSIKDLEVVKSEKDRFQSSGLVSGLTAMRNSLLRESKDIETFSSKELQAHLSSLFAVEALQSECMEQVFQARLPADIHGAPPRSFVSHLAEIMGGIGTYRQMAEFWRSVVAELRHCWEEGQPVPRLSVDSKPDLRYCLILQKLQAINCCIARQKRHYADLEFLDALNECMELSPPNNIQEIDSFFSLLKSRSSDTLRTKDILEPSKWFVELKTGQILLRLGADHPAGDLKMLETGQQVYSPITQDGAVLTEDLIEETEELVLRTRSVGPGCSQLLSDMQAFKAANPGCILEDFVRWYSPLDWWQCPETTSPVENHEQRNRGCLSARMQSQEGNLWQELWSSAKPVPAAKQAPLFDEDLAVESILDALDGIKPVDLFEQLFKAILGSGFTIAEQTLSGDNVGLLSQFNECKNFATLVCHKGMDSYELEQLCQVYELMENILQQSSKQVQSSGGSSCSINDNDEQEPQSSINGKSDNRFRFFARILETKNMLFEKKLSQDEKRTESNWTLL